MLSAKDCRIAIYIFIQWIADEYDKKIEILETAQNDANNLCNEFDRYYNPFGIAREKALKAKGMERSRYLYGKLYRISDELRGYRKIKEIQETAKKLYEMV